jgi:hypothetical protein
MSETSNNVRGDALYDWCSDKFHKFGDETICNDLTNNLPNNEDLVKLINEEVMKMSEEELVNSINTKRKQILDIKNMVQETNFMTNKRKYEEMKVIQKEIILELILFGIMLGIAICLAIFLIYYYFRFERTE